MALFQKVLCIIGSIVSTANKIHPRIIVFKDLKKEILLESGDIVDVDFTAHMEQELDRVEEGKLPWKDVIRGFYTSFTEELKSAETALEGIRIKVPEEVTDEICELCGKPMVIKTGRFGKFLGCSGFPECKNTKPIVVRMPGRCPKCGNTSKTVEERPPE